MATESTNDPLARLVVDEREVNREVLATALENRVRLDLQRGTFTFLHGVRDRLNAHSSVVTALLAQQALHLLDGRHAPGLAPHEIEACTGIPGGTLRPVLKRLADGGLVRKIDKAYTVPGYALEQLAGELREESNGR